MPLPITQRLLNPSKHIILSHCFRVLGMARRYLSDEGVALPRAMLMIFGAGCVRFWLSMAVVPEIIGETIALS